MERWIKTGLLAVVLLPALSFAQPRTDHTPMKKFWKNPEAQKALGLTESQVQQLEELFTQKKKALVELRAEVEKRKIDLDTAVEDPRADDKRILAEIDRFEEARSKLSRARAALLLVETRKLLSTEQRQALQAWKNKHADRKLRRHRDTEP